MLDLSIIASEVKRLRAEGHKIEVYITTPEGVEVAIEEEEPLPVPIALPSTTAPMFGWNCSSCGAFVPSGSSHVCLGYGSGSPDLGGGYGGTC